MALTWQEVASKVLDLAPLAGGIFGGPLGAGVGTAIKVIAQAFGIKDQNPQPEQVMAAIQADPQAAMTLQMAAMTYNLEMAKTAMEDRDRVRDDALNEIKAYMGDVQSARGADVAKTQATGSRDINLYLLSWVIVVGFFGLITLLLYRPVPQDSSGVIFMLFGSVASAFGAVVAFNYGTTRSSKDKDITIANSIPAETLNMQGSMTSIKTTPKP